MIFAILWRQQSMETNNPECKRNVCVRENRIGAINNIFAILIEIILWIVFIIPRHYSYIRLSE